MGYTLLDSGEGWKLERFGEVTLVRPARSAIWKKNGAPELWNRASASFEHGAGWKFAADTFESWEVPLPIGNLTLRLQRNGQIGFFPEHMLYLDQLKIGIGKTQSSAPKVLNLFAYTGLATVFCAKSGCHVTHVDISKQALEWAEINLSRNGIDSGLVRFIKEDASAFIAREIRRGASYEIIILDPPSFSRVSKSSTWDLEDVLSRLLADCCTLLNKESGTIFFTSHNQGLGRFEVANVLMDALGAEASILHQDLVISEHNSARKLHSGYLVSASSKIG